MPMGPIWSAFGGPVDLVYVYYMYYIISNHKMVLKCVCNDSEMLFNDFERFCL